MDDTLVFSLHALMGLSLAACAGLRAFMPLFVVGLMARFGEVPLGADFGWIGSDTALVVFGMATLIELIGDKFPLVDHALDAVGTVIKPVAATLIFASVMIDLSPLQATVLGIVSAGSTATIMHLKKASLRLLASTGTFGMANPVVSTLEDVACGAGIALSLLAPVLAMAAVITTLLFGFWLVRRIRPALKFMAPRAKATV
ncbi:MAG: DUF4126 domain-containing protein [Armatimonadetes bacterium]|nr:DUF4126 domain-containing protein [Armatimonadota bacterium]